MNGLEPIVYGTDREHTKVFQNERHCFNCSHYTDLECTNLISAPSQFIQKPSFDERRLAVYLGRSFGGICAAFTLKGKEWDR